jgi:hypothetical protein
MIPEPLRNLLECYCMYEARGPRWPSDLHSVLESSPGLLATFQSQLARAIGDATPNPDEFGQVVHQRGEFETKDDVQAWLLDLWLELFPGKNIDDFTK